MKLRSRYRFCLSKSIRVYIAGYISKDVTRGGVRKERVKVRQVISRYLMAKSGLILYLVKRHVPLSRNYEDVSQNRHIEISAR